VDISLGQILERHKTGKLVAGGTKGSKQDTGGTVRSGVC